MNFERAGVYSKETDLSGYIKGMSTSIPGIVGVFEKGLIDTPIYVTKDDYFKKIGSEVDGYTDYEQLSAYFNNGGSQGYVVRVTGRDETGKTKATKSTTTLVDALSEEQVIISAKNEGVWGNKIKVTTRKGTDDIDDRELSEIKIVCGNDTEKYVIYDISEIPLINSELVDFELAESVDLEVKQLLEDVTDQTLTGGTNGLDGFKETDYLGTKKDGTGLYSLATKKDITLVAIPGATDGNVNRQIIEFTETSTKGFAVLGMPLDISPEEAVDYRYGKGSYEHPAFNSSYGALYYPGLVIDSKKSSKGIEVTGVGHVLGRYAYNDEQAFVWNAPAGIQGSKNIGVIKGARGVSRELNEGEQGLLYKSTINPIVNMVESGVTIWGQKTLASKTSALDRINVRRLMQYTKTAIDKSSLFYVFEPDSSTTWNAFLREVNPFLRDMQSNGAFYDFLVVCDETINTPTTIDRNEMHVKVYVKPTKTAEFIAIDYVVTATGTEFSELTE